MNDRGVECLIDALKVNRVRRDLFMTITYKLLAFSQTLTTLIFENGEISDKGAIYLTDALLANQVSEDISSSVKHCHTLEKMKTPQRKENGKCDYLTQVTTNTILFFLIKLDPSNFHKLSEGGF